MSTSALIIFVKNAEKGKVKTRLAQTLGEEKTLQIYKALLAHTREVAQKIAVDRLLFYSNFIEKEDDWSGNYFQKHIQVGEDLGHRMLQGFQLALTNRNKAVIIGSDCASLTAEIIQEAFDQLDHHDFVIGPAMDGGYYLLGMLEPNPGLFEQMEWSTEEVFSTTINRIQGLGKTYYLLPELSDIDYAEDWEKYGWDI